MPLTTLEWVAGALAFSLAAGAANAQTAAEGSWTGSVQCRIDVSGAAYERHEEQSWTLTGEAPRIEGAMRIYPAVWKASGRGTASTNTRRPSGAEWTAEVPGQPTVMAVFIRASDNRLVFKQWQPRAQVAGALRVGGLAVPVAEWGYGWIVDSPSQTTVRGTSAQTAEGLPAQLTEAGVTPNTECNWEFRKEGLSLIARSPTAPTTGLQLPGQPKNLPNTPVGKVTGVKAEDQGGGRVRLSWTPVSGAGGYQITGIGIATPLTIAAAQAETSLVDVPAGPGHWGVVALNAQGLADPANRVAVSTVVRVLPAHAPAYLTKNNGAGTAASTLAHYKSACDICVPGVTFAEILKWLGVPDGVLDGDADLQNGGVNSGLMPWSDSKEARYRNVTEFDGERVTRCYEPDWAGAAAIICYANTSDHGLTLIIRKAPNTWFLTFDGPPSSQSEVLSMPAARTVTSAYTLSLTSRFDSEGSKFAPNTCIACHGGRLDPVTHKVEGASFLPVDPARITARDANHHLVNQTIMRSVPAASVRIFLTGLYGGNPSGARAAGDYVPAGWAAQPELYRQVVRPYCISCHLNTPTGVDFSTSAKFMAFRMQTLESVCVKHSMPHSEHQFKEFWTRDTGAFYLPGYLATILGGGDCR